jgi:GT2 family glycosyltransferase
MTDCAVQAVSTPLDLHRATAAVREIDVSIVTYEPQPDSLANLLASVEAPAGGAIRRNFLIHDNTLENLGFGRGHNANVARGSAPFVLLINQDCVLEPGVLEALLERAHADPDDVAAWELRQIPYEHPKTYDPVTLETVWVSGAAVLVRRAAFEAVGGFDPRIFMYGEDVDLSWRLRAAGWRLLYQPKLAVIHHTYRQAGEVKPLQVFGGVFASLCLRARYGGWARTLQGLVLLAGQIAARESFPGRRRGLVKAGMRFVAEWRHFAASRVRATAAFKPFFAGWSYEPRRQGAFHRFSSHQEKSRQPRPLVSILIRTCGRPALLREALASCANQTYAPLEVVVIEDGPARSQAVIDTFSDRLVIRYHATGHTVGRARAGNLAMQHARGAWLNFLDDDDAFFADHVEVLVEAVQRSGLPAAYALAWEFLDRPNAHCDDARPASRHYQRFDRFLLWHHNYLPIQTVLFSRRLFERLGGFAEDMDCLEDWNLWTRYCLENDFEFVEKTTSKYRVPEQSSVAAGRQEALDNAYAGAIERQRELRISISPREISEMLDAHARKETLVMVTRSDLRRFIGRHRALARLAAYRQSVHRIVRRLGCAK